MMRTVGPPGLQVAFTVRNRLLVLLLLSVCSLHTAVSAQKTTHSCKLLINGSSKVRELASSAPTMRVQLQHQPATGPLQHLLTLQLCIKPLP